VSQGSLFSTRFTLALAIYLLGGAALAFFTPFEPFPAVMLPGGGEPVPIKDGVARFESVGLWGRTPEGEKKRIVVSDFLAPIPDYYVFGVARTGFGYTNPKPRKVELGPFVFRVSQPERSREMRREVVVWLQHRLHEAGLAEDSLMVRKDEIEIDMASDRELARKRLSEKRFRIH